MPRLFTGIEIPQDIRLALSMKRGGLPGARWLEREDYHITLRFIGDVDHVMARDIAGALEQQSYLAPFTVRLTHLDVFGGDKPRSLFVRVEQNENLSRLFQVQEKELQMTGLTPEGRKFLPHVTLARLRGVCAGEVARYLDQTNWFEPMEFLVTRFVLYSSKGSIGGGPYVVEDIFELEG